MSAPTRTYAFDNHHQAAAGHHAALAELLDPFTRGRIHGLGLDLSRATRCLEVGAGAGSVALWLADQVAPGGQVVAVDLEPDHIPAHPRLVTLGHDLTDSRPWPPVLAGPFALIHARLLLAHLPNRRGVLHQLAARLAPGGVLLVEDWSALRDEVVIAAPSRPAAEVYQQLQRAITAVLEAAGVDRGWARRIHPAMREEGLVEVDTVIHGGYWTGGGPGLRVVAAGLPQLAPGLLAAGLSTDQLDQLAALVYDPDLVIHGHPLYSTSGRRPV